MLKYQEKQMVPKENAVDRHGNRHSYVYDRGGHRSEPPRNIRFSGGGGGGGGDGTGGFDRERDYRGGDRGGDRGGYDRGRRPIRQQVLVASSGGGDGRKASMGA